MKFLIVSNIVEKFQTCTSYFLSRCIKSSKTVKSYKGYSFFFKIFGAHWTNEKDSVYMQKKITMAKGHVRLTTHQFRKSYMFPKHQVSPMMIFGNATKFSLTKSEGIEKILSETPRHQLAVPGLLK